MCGFWVRNLIYLLILGTYVITTLAEGKVEVNDDKISKVYLKPGEQAICAKGVRFIEVKNVDVSLFTSWVKVF